MCELKWLTNRQSTLFKEVVKRKYNINITLDQIVNLVPSKFECAMNFYVERISECS